MPTIQFQIERIAEPGLPPKPLDPPAIFLTPREAADRATLLNNTAKAQTPLVSVRYKVSKFTPTPADHATPTTPDWHARELNRFETGHYKPCPPVPSALPDRHPEHFIHVSNKNPSRLAYTPTAQHGIEDRTIAISPGTYLERYYSSTFTPSQILSWVSQFDDGYQLNFATTADEIEQVYRNGPSSCMSHDPSAYFTPFHPVRVYGLPPSEVQLAYITGPNDPSTPIARCLVWPSQLKYSRRYSDTSGVTERLTAKLQKLGYSPDEDGLSGAKIAAVKHPSRPYFILPYIDWNGYVTEVHNQPYLLIGSHPTRGTLHLAQNTNGLSGGSDDDDYDYEDENNSWTCDHCGDRHQEDDQSYAVDGDSWCPSCFENYAHSCDCGAASSSSDFLTTTVTGDHLCEHCRDSYYTYCESCEEWVHDRTLVGNYADTGDKICSDCVAKMGLINDPENSGTWIEPPNDDDQIPLPLPLPEGVTAMSMSTMLDEIEAGHDPLLAHAAE